VGGGKGGTFGGDEGGGVGGVSGGAFGGGGNGSRDGSGRDGNPCPGGEGGERHEELVVPCMLDTSVSKRHTDIVPAEDMYISAPNIAVFS